MKQNIYLWGAFFILVIPALACGPATSQVTPTPTKTPRLIRTLEPLSSPTVIEAIVPTQTFTPEIPPTDTPIPEPVATDTPTPEPVPPTDTPPPPPTNTPAPPPPPTNTPAPPPPPTNTPAPPPPTQPPANAGPQVVIELPSGDKYGIGDEVKVIIRVSDPDGVKQFEWGVFTQNNVAVKGGNRSCGNSAECSVDEEFEAILEGTFQIGVEAEDANGGKTIEAKQIYVG